MTGLIISGAVYWFACTNLRYKPASDYMMVKNLLLGIKYAFKLILETSKANFAVFRIVMGRKINIRPQLVYFRTDLRKNVALVALASSINLTPGTVTVDLDDGLFCIHCLDAKFAEGISDSVLVRHLSKMER